MSGEVDMSSDIAKELQETVSSRYADTAAMVILVRLKKMINRIRYRDTPGFADHVALELFLPTTCAGALRRISVVDDDRVRIV